MHQRLVAIRTTGPGLSPFLKVVPNYTVATLEALALAQTAVTLGMEHRAVSL
jgi:hypothetical protein